MSEQIEPTPYERLGGEAAVRRLVNRFYDLMEDAEVRKLRAMHARDLSPMREKLFEFMSGWLGGPPLYFERPDHACIGTAHSAFAIDAEARDQWLACMDRALADIGADPATRQMLEQPLYRIADAFRNR
jgi:hemoglobin